MKNGEEMTVELCISLGKTTQQPWRRTRTEWEGCELTLHQKDIRIDFVRVYLPELWWWCRISSRPMRKMFRSSMAWSLPSHYLLVGQRPNILNGKNFHDLLPIAKKENQAQWPRVDGSERLIHRLEWKSVHRWKMLALDVLCLLSHRRENISKQEPQRWDMLETLRVYWSYQ
jgi:hypothetical protein